MAITISGENNNDKILASDGVIDQISGINIVGVITATSFTGDLTGNVTGNLTGNVNSTSPLLLQTGGSERFRITGNNELGIAGANYGTSGQVLTSGGSGSAVSWATPAVTAFTNGSNNRIITATGANTLLGEQNLTFDSTTLAVTGNITATGNFVANGTMNVGSYAVFGAVVGADPGSNYYGTTNRFGGGVSISGALNIDGDIGHIGDTNTKIRFPANDTVTVETAGSERLRITSDGKIGIGEDDPDGNYLLIRAASTVGTKNGHIMLTGDSATNGQGPQIVFSESGSGSNYAGAYIGHAREGSNSQGSLIFATRATSGDANTVPTERLRIMSDGEIKINHTQSSTPLNNTFISIYDANSDSSAIDASGVSRNYAMINLHNYGTGNNGDATGIGFGAGSAFSFTKGSIAFQRQGSYGTGDLVFLTNNDQDTTMVNDTDEKMRITRDGKIGVGNFSSLTARANLHIHQPDSNGSFLRFTNSTSGTGASDGAEIGLDSDEGLSIFNYENDYIRFGTNSTERLRIDENGRFIFGHTAALQKFHGPYGTNKRNPQIQINGVNVQQASMSLTSWDNNVVGYYGPAIFLAKSGSSTIGTNSRVSNLNSILGSIIFSGDDGDEFIKAAMIQAAVDTSTGGNDMPGRLQFLTTRDGAQEPTERLRILSNGRIKFIEDPVQRNSGAKDNFSGDGAYMQHYVSRDGSTYRRNLDIASVGDGSWGSSIRFSTNPDSNSTTQEAMRINHLRQVKIGGTYNDTSHQLLVDNGSCDFKGRVYVRESLSFYSTPFGANVTLDTGISVNGGGYGGSILAICSRNFGAGTNTQSGLYLIKFHYDGNNTPQIIHIAGTNMATFGQSGSNTLTVSMGPSNNMFTAIESSVG